MTNEEAIKELSEWLDACCGEEEIEPTREALRMAIEALKAQMEKSDDLRAKSAQNVQNGDLISRKLAIDAADKIIERDTSGNNDVVKAMTAWKMYVEALPSAQPDNRLSKIADLVEGTIDHFDLDDAMDLLYQIKDVLDSSDELPSAQPEPCEDAVSRQTLQKELALYSIDDITSEDEAGYNRAINDVQKMVLHLPSAQPERKTGKWIEFDCIEDKYDEIKCPCCKHIFTVDSYHWTDIGFIKDDFKFCPNCGADMRGEPNEDR